MIQDGRSNKIIFVAHCVLNSNAICEGPKTPSIWPAMIDEVVEVLKKNRVGIVQIRCPEVDFFGLTRGYDTKTALDTKDFREYCRKIAIDTANVAEKYVKAGVNVVGFLGKRGSPTCAVKKLWVTKNGKQVLVNDSGIFVEELTKELKNRGITVPFIDFEREELEKSIKDLENSIK